MKYLPFACLVSLLLWLAACANPGSGPDGGPYDETPPRIVGMTPSLGETGEKSKKVSIMFDELVKVENAQEKIIVSPPQIEAPEIKVSGKRITVSLMDTLKPSTTYTIDFSDAIVDANESNPLGNFTYFFSTGQEVDTMEVGGYVLNAADLEPVKGILVGLHAEMDDSAFTTKPFDRVARTDSRGRFSVKGVARGKYRIYALNDMDNDFKYVRGETLAFSRDTVVPSSFPDVRYDTLWADTTHIDTIKAVKYTHFTPDGLVLLSFSETNASRQLLKTQREPAWFRTYFTAPSRHVPLVEGLNFDSRNAFVEERSAGNDTITYWLRDTLLYKQDTLRIRYTYEATDDSTEVNSLYADTLELVPRFGYERRLKLEEEQMAKWRKQLERRHRRGDFSQETPPVAPLKLEFLTRAKISPMQNVLFTLDEPAARIDTTGFHLFLKVDSTYREVPFRLSRDSLSIRNYVLRSEWRPGQEYVLNVDSASIVGISGKVNKNSDMQLSVPASENYASLFLILPDADTSAVVQLMQGDKIVGMVKSRNGRADFFYLNPGTYYLRMFYDRNGDGKWTTGSWAEKRAAEEVFYFPSQLELRANWDVEQTWRVNDLPLYRQKPRELVKQKEETKRTPKNRNAERERNRR